MSVSTYEEIVRHLDELEPAQLARLMGELRARMTPQPRYRLEDFLLPSGKPNGSGEDWVGELRAEWDDRS